MTALRVTSTRQGSIPLLHVSGDIDLGTAETVRSTLQAQLDDTPDACLLADLSDVSFLDCTGLEALLGVARRAAARGGWLRLTSPSRHVTRILELTGTSEQLRTYDAGDAVPTGRTPPYVEMPDQRTPGSLHPR